MAEGGFSYSELVADHDAESEMVYSPRSPIVEEDRGSRFHSDGHSSDFVDFYPRTNDESENSEIFPEIEEIELMEKPPPEERLSSPESDEASPERNAIATEIDEEIFALVSAARCAIDKLVSVRSRTFSPEGNISDRESRNRDSSLESCGERRRRSIASSRPADGISVDQCRVGARLARAAAEEANEAVQDCRELISTIDEAMDSFRCLAQNFSSAALEANSDNESELGFYLRMHTRLNKAVGTLKRKRTQLQIALQRARQAVEMARKEAADAESVTIRNGTLHVSVVKFRVFWWKNKANAACTVARKKERSGLLVLKKIWTDLLDEENRRYVDGPITVPSFDSERESRNFKLICGINLLIIVLGGCILTLLAVYELGTTSFTLSLILGILLVAIPVAYGIYRCHRLAKYISNKVFFQRQEISALIARLDQRLKHVQRGLRRLDVSPRNSLSDDDAGSVSTVRVDDICPPNNPQQE